MKKLISLIFALPILLIGCTQVNTTSKPMTQLTFNEEQAACMSAIACFEAQGNQERLAVAINQGLDAQLSVSQIKEALSQLYAYTGFPRSLNALGTLQKVIAGRDSSAITILGNEPSPLSKDYDALQQGTMVQTMLTGQPFNYQFAPATDYYLKAHLFGDIFARDNLTYADRELVTVSALAGLQGVEPQLQAHVSGARNMGLTDTQLLAIPLALTARVGQCEAARVAVALQRLGIADEENDKLAANIQNNAAELNSPWRLGVPNSAYAQYFIGNSYVSPYGDAAVNVSFEPGCRNNWHIHHGAVQVLICVYGKGWYQEWGKPAIPLVQGTVIEVPEGVKHWHGAAADSWMQHLTYHKNLQPDASNEWLEPVTDEQYNKIH